MKKILFCFLSVYISFVFSDLKAQSQFSGWLASFNTFKTTRKTSIHADVQWRSSDEWTHTQTLLLRSGLNVHLNKHFTVTGGYAFIQNRRVMSNINGYAPEHRIWEQLVYNHKIKTITVSHRLRLEQRFIAKTFIVDEKLKTDGSLYANRLRYFFRNVLPFQHQKAFTKGWFAALQNEVFVNIGNKTNVNGKFFDQNRLYLAMGYRLSKSFDLETGYLNQHINGRNNSFTNNHVWQLAGYLRL